MALERRQTGDGDPDALAADAAARLRRGELVVLPTETVYGLAALPSHASAAAALRRWKQADAAQPFALHIADARDLQRLAPEPPAAVVRLVERYWPGPLTVVVRGRDGDPTGVRLPAHELTRAVIRAVGEPLWLTCVQRPGEAPQVEPDAVAAAVGDAAQLLVADGPSPLGTPSTVVRATGPRLEILREGILSAADVLHTAAKLVLFVCTGNTCRSPMAEALAQDLTARTLGVARDEVLAHGYAFASAGVSALPGGAASEGSLAAAAELELDLAAHQSRPLDLELLQRADRVYCMGRSHLSTILAEVPDAAGKTQMLRADGLDIGDPYGSDLRVYRRVRDEIRAAVGARLPEWLPG